MNVKKSLNTITQSKFLIPKNTLSKHTISISFTSNTKNGNSDRATKHSFVGLILTTVFYGQPKNYKSSSGISTSIGVLLFDDAYSTSFA